jgi:probable rRNA maturation factor
MPRSSHQRTTRQSWRRAKSPAPKLPEVRLDIVREVPLAFDDDWVARVVTAAVATAGRRTRTNLTVLFADDDHLQHLNRQFRGLDKPTDVLSFEAGGLASGTAYIGDVAISVPRALEQGERHGHGVGREVGYLLVHGVLHLLGFDHEVDADQAAMRLAEEKALARVRLERSYVVEPDEL